MDMSSNGLAALTYVIKQGVCQDIADKAVAAILPNARLNA
jgi:hypothetical protein